MALKDLISLVGKEDAIRIIVKKLGYDGGPGSGNFGHAGRPGKVGGSAPEGQGGSGETSEKQNTLSGMKVRVANSIAKKARQHPKVYDDWAGSLTADEAREIEEQFRNTHTPDEQGHYDESYSDYYERIWKMLASEAKEVQQYNKIVNGSDISMSYDWNGVSYTEPKFGQVIDTQIEDVLNRQGFNGVPKVIPKAEFDKFIKDHPEAPIMMRTFSAPDQKTLEQYDSDLEKGAWYVDCGIGGSKYGQGMYTAAALPWNKDELDSVYSKYVFHGSTTGKFVKDGDNVYQLGYDSTATMPEMGSLPVGQIVVFHDTSSEETAVLEKKSDEEYYDLLLKRTYDAYSISREYDLMAPASIIPQDMLSKRDEKYPLDQMRGYIDTNANLVNKNSGVGKEYRDELEKLYYVATFLGWGIPEGTVPKVISNGPEDYDGTTKYFKVDEDSAKKLTREGYDSLEEGSYVAIYKGMGIHEGKNRMWLFTKDSNGDVTSEKRGTDVETPERHVEIALQRGATLYKCKDITPQKPSPPIPCTRKMTLDPSAKTITFEKLDKMYIEYNNEFSKGNHRSELVDKVAKAENLSGDQKESFGWAVHLWENMLELDLKRDPTYLKCARDLGGEEKTDRLIKEYARAKEERQKHKLDDISAFGAAKGYDAVICSNYGRTIVVLNRTKLILSDEHVEVPREEAS